MSQNNLDTSYRAWSVDTLNAVKTSVLLQLKAIEGMGQSHSANSRSTTLVDLDTLTQKLSNIENALAWKRNIANTGNNGYASRFASFGGC